MNKSIDSKMWTKEELLEKFRNKKDLEIFFAKNGKLININQRLLSSA